MEAIEFMFHVKRHLGAGDPWEDHLANFYAMEHYSNRLALKCKYNIDSEKVHDACFFVALEPSRKVFSVCRHGPDQLKCGSFIVQLDAGGAYSMAEMLKKLDGR